MNPSSPCPDASTFVAMLEGELDAPERQTMDEHLDRCQACAALVAELGLLFEPGPEEGGAPAGVALGQISRYQVLRVVGQGGMGVVYEAFDEALQRRVAVKLLKPELVGPGEGEGAAALRREMRDRLRREARLLARVVHPHVLPVYDVGTWEGEVFVAMHFVEGAPLSEHLEATRPGWRGALELYLEAGEGLAAAHRHGVVHRDVKPGNVLVGRDGGVWVADFGLASAVGAATPAGDAHAQLPSSALTRTGAVLGTPAYMPPEQHLGEGADARSDQFSFCASLYHSLYGSLPFAGSTVQELALNICAGRLKAAPAGSEVPEAVYAVLARGLGQQPGQRYPAMDDLLEALRSAAEASGPQPPQELASPDAFVGRASSLAALEALCGPSALVTVVGPAGTGKTRLAREFGGRGWGGALVFCDLTEARSAQDVAEALAVALDVPLTRAEAVGMLGGALHGLGRALLVLDNMEQLLSGEVGAQTRQALSRWMEAAPELALLLTSRQRLGLEGERVLTLDPLEVPAEGDALAEVSDCEAARLFALRARAARPSFAVTGDNQAELIQLLRLLDGLPLAIELAAARARVLSVGQILERMSSRFALLRRPGGSVGEQAPRRVALQAALDWSWDLLTEPERGALSQASVFDGGFTLEDAEAVIDVGRHGLGPLDVLDLVDALVEKSLLKSEVGPAGARYGMLLAVQQHAADKLAAAGPQARQGAERRHGEAMARRGEEEALAALFRHGGIARLRQLQRDRDNLRAACRRAVARGDAAMATHLALALGELSTYRGPFLTAAAQISSVLELDGLSAADRGLMLHTRARLLRLGGRLEQARADEEEARPLLKDAGEAHAHAVCVGHLAVIDKTSGNPEAARRGYQEAIRLCVDADERRYEGVWRGQLAILDSNQGDTEAARRGYRQARDIAVEVGDRRYEAIWRCNLATLARNRGDLDAAREGYSEALAIAAELGDRRFEGSWNNLLAALNHDQGRYDDAREGYARALDSCRALGNRRALSATLGNVAILEQELGDHGAARRRYEEAIATARAIDNPRHVAFWQLHLAALDQEVGRPEAAREGFEAGLATCDRLGLRHYEGMGLVGLAHLAADAGDLPRALEGYDEALTLARDLGDPRSEGIWLSELAALHAHRGDSDEARRCFDQSEALLRPLDARLHLAHTLSRRGFLEADLGDPQKARACALESAALLDGIDVKPDAAVYQSVLSLRTRLESD